MKSELLHSLPCIFRSHSFIGSSLEAQSARRRSKSTSMASSVEVQSTRIATMFSLEPVCLYMLLYITIYYYMLCSLYAIICYRISYAVIYYGLLWENNTRLANKIPDVKHTPWIQLAELCPSVEQRISPGVEASRLPCHSAGRSGSGGLVPSASKEWRIDETSTALATT